MLHVLFACYKKYLKVLSQNYDHTHLKYDQNLKFYIVAHNFEVSKLHKVSYNSLSSTSRQ